MTPRKTTSSAAISEMRYCNLPFHIFPLDLDKQELWVSVLPNILAASVTKHIGICALHWLDGHPIEVATEVARRPSVPPSVFNVPSSFFRRTANAKSRNVQNYKLNIENRAEK